MSKVIIALPATTARVSEHTAQSADVFVQHSVMPEIIKILDEKVPMLIHRLHHANGLTITPALARNHIVSCVKKSLI